MKAAIVLRTIVAKEQELHELLCSAEVPDEIREEWEEWAEKTIKRAIERGRKKAVPLAWLEWANKWESGEDRTAEAAETAFKAKWSHNAPTPNGQTAKHATRAAYVFASDEPYMLRNNIKFVCVSDYCKICANWSVAWVNNNNVSRHVMYAEITKQLDDLISLIEAYKPEGSVSDKLYNVAETKLERAVASIAGKRGGDCTDFVKDVLSGGCVNGTVGELIYTGDCVAFYRKHKKDIQSLVKDLMNDCGIDSMKGLFGDKFDSEDPFCEENENQNLLAWFGFEEALRLLADRIELDI